MMLILILNDYPKNILLEKKPAGNEAYSINHIRLMLEYAGSKRNKALILAIATGGLREGRFQHYD